MLPVYRSNDSKITVWVTNYREGLIEIYTYIFNSFALFYIKVFNPKDYVNKIYKHTNK